MASGSSERVYRVQNPDGTWRGEGCEGGAKEGQRKVKTWNKPGHLKNHLKMAGSLGGGSSYRHTPKALVEHAGLTGAEVVEYELVEVRRIPVEEFLRGNG